MRWSKAMPDVLNVAFDTWMTLFASYLVLTIALEAIQYLRGKLIFQTRLFPALALLWTSWVFPLAFPFLILYWIFKRGGTAFVLVFLIPIWLFHKVVRYILTIPIPSNGPVR